MPRKLARSLGLDHGEDEVEDIDPVGELTSGGKSDLAMDIILPDDASVQRVADRFAVR